MVGLTRWLRLLGIQYYSVKVYGRRPQRNGGEIGQEYLQYGGPGQAAALPLSDRIKGLTDLH